MDIDIQNEIDALKMISIGSIISQYGLLMMKDKSKFELRNRTNMAIKFCNSVQDWFRFHPKCSQKTMNVLTIQFNDSKIVLLADLLKYLYSYDEDTIEYILEQIRKADEEMQQTTAFAPTECEGLE